MPALLKTGAHEYSDENNNKNTLVEATHPFVASNAKQLSFNKHERLKLLQMHDSGWWIVENEKGEVGLIPANYVRVYDVSNLVKRAITCKKQIYMFARDNCRNQLLCEPHLYA